MEFDGDDYEPEDSMYTTQFDIECDMMKVSVT